LGFGCAKGGKLMTSGRPDTRGIVMMNVNNFTVEGMVFTAASIEVVTPI
jgi:hypothetical protein